jgi:hypothetical protein
LVASASMRKRPKMTPRVLAFMAVYVLLSLAWLCAIAIGGNLGLKAAGLPTIPRAVLLIAAVLPTQRFLSPRLLVFCLRRMVPDAQSHG